MLDPDIKQAIDNLGDEVGRLRLCEQRLITMPESDPAKREVRAMIGEIKALVRLRAEKIRVDPQALLVIIDEHSRLWKQMRRRPAPEMLLRTVSATADILERERASAVADFHLARAAAKRATERGAAAHTARLALTGEGTSR